MKKKLMLALTVCALAAVVTACGSKAGDAKETTTAAATETTTADNTKETTTAKAGEAKKETATAEASEAKKETTTVEETTESGPQAGPGMAVDASQAEMDNQKLTALENSDYTGFAKQVVAAVTSKDINALADLMAYPTYVAFVKENKGVVDTKEQFLALDQEMLFDQALIDEMTKADLSDLTPLMAGVVIGEDTPCITIDIQDGKLGITGINY